MQIRFTSSLTPDDENSIAPPLLKAISAILDMLPIAYALRIETSDARVYQHSHPARTTVPGIADPVSEVGRRLDVD